MGRPKIYDLPDNMSYDVNDGRYYVRNPLTGKRKKFSNEGQARQVAAALNKLLETEEQLKALKDGRPTFHGLVEKWKTDRLQFMPWDDGTRGNVLAKMHRIQRELGGRTLVHTDSMFLEEWISSFTKTADTFNDWRYVFNLLLDFAVSRHLVAANEGAKVLYRSTSKKIEANRKQRQQLDLAGFNDIREKAEPWLQLAMDVSLVTLLARNEICNMQHAHFRDGFLFVIRKKTSGESDMAFIKIELNTQLLELKERSLALDAPAADPKVKRLHPLSPYVIHRAPEQMRRQWIDEKVKPHWRYITPDFLSKAFGYARDQLERFSTLKARQKPSFHEIRGLGMRTYEDLGMAKDQIRALAAQANEKTTEIYLERGVEALTNDHYQTVNAPLILRTVLKEGVTK